jgi:arsenate reductase
MLTLPLFVQSVVVMRYALFVCNHNAGRSQMAQAFFERHAPEDVRAESAGSTRARALWPTVVEAMAEVGFDLGDRKPRKLVRELQLHADWAVTMGCGDVCPYVPTTVEAWDIPDPAGLALEQVRPIRDAIERHVRELVESKLDAIRSDPTAHRFRLTQLLPGLAEEFEGSRSPEEIRACPRRGPVALRRPACAVLRSSARASADPRMPARGRLRRSGGCMSEPTAPTMNAALQRRLRAIATRLTAEYDGVFSPETVDALVRDSIERLGAITVTEHLPLLTERFARQRLQAAAQADGLLPKPRPLVLFVCAQNAARSQMAAALARHVSEGRIDVMSAGSDPASAINHAVVEAIAELGIEMAFEFPKPLTDEVVRAADVVVTMGCGEACPVLAGPRYLSWAVADPAGQDLAAVRRIRQDIADHVLDLLKELLP